MATFDAAVPDVVGNALHGGEFRDCSVADLLHNPECMGRGGVFAVDSLSGLYVLVVDAEKDRRALLTGILRYCGALVTPVETLANAFAVMDVLKPDVVVVEFSSHGDAGVQMIARLRAQEGNARTVAAVAVGESGLESLARERGFDAYIEKPFDPWELCRVVSSLSIT